MITVNQQSKLMESVESLSELEFASLIEEIFDHVKKNKWDHIVESCCEAKDINMDGMLDKIADAEEEANVLEGELRRSEREAERLNDKIVDITVQLSKVDEAFKEINKLI